MRENVIHCSHDDPAFPNPGEQFGHGLTKREEFASRCLAALIPIRPTNVARDEIAAEAAHYADALIFVLNEIEIGDKVIAVHCEHGVADGDWCEECNMAMKKARLVYENRM